MYSNKYYMRNLLNIIQTISEAAVGLSPSNMSEASYAWRFEKFIEKIRARQPFTTVDREAFLVDPREADRIQALYDSGAFKGTVKIRSTSDVEISISKLAKTTEFGGAAAAFDQEESEAGKEGLLVKPGQIGITDRNISADQLYDEIKNNTVLNGSDYGQTIIQLAEYIVAGEYVMLPEEYRKADKKAMLKAIVDYAGEYLGPLALIYNRSRFPRRADFEKWLGGDMGALVLNFPASANNNLADSFATITNPNTSHTLNISSKGTGGGAAPAISGLKVPDHIASDPNFADAVEFIDICQNMSTVEQSFAAMDLLFRVNSKSLNKKWHAFLPFADKHPTLESRAKQSLDAGKKRQDVPLPTQFKVMFSDIKSDKASDGGKLIYAIKKEVASAINERDGIPEFDAAVLQILEMNFIQQYADYKGGELTFATQWPAKLHGDISVVNKSSAVDPTAGGFSFKLGRVTEADEPGVDGEEPDASTDISTDDDIQSGAERIATGRSAPARKSTAAPGEVGREKRKR